MKYFIHYFQKIVDGHKLALISAFAVGVLYIAPHIIFVISLGNEYQGIPNFQTPNEISYLARVREILDGHRLVGSPFFFEYKDQFPLAPPTGEYFYAVPAYLLGVSAENILVTSKFVLPATLFFLIYALVYKLVSDGKGAVPRKITAVAGALLITLGYDLIDFRTVLNFVSGESSPGGFLLWSRPVNPILGAIFLFSFLLFVRAVINSARKTDGFTRYKFAITGASLFLALMISSYFFSWGIAASVLFTLILLYFFRGEYKLVKRLSFIFLFGALFSAPYWINARLASKSEWYSSSVLRSGIFYTHYPLLNKLMIAALIFYVLAVGFDFFRARRKRIPYTFEDWHLFLLSFILGSLWAYSQQIITGQTVWPYHFVQYSIPLAMVAGLVILHNVFKKMSFHLWLVGILFMVSASLFYGLYVQAVAYQSLYEYQVDRQSYRPLFDWLNSRDKDCVVLIDETSPSGYELNEAIPAFTHCNRYASSEMFSVMPYERGLRGYLTLLRLKSVTSDGIDKYLAENRRRATGYLYSNWQGLFNVQDFPDFSDELLEERLMKFPEEYRLFLKKDFTGELKKYRLDYIVSVGFLPDDIIDELPGLMLKFNENNLFVYSFSQ
ncbi:MAG: hypothetical protein HYY55_04630 [Candidatus Niyogibacteria bacterium]|nr:MAG: hypothetical protein HYY55_04630 [Candidatus Niyogibacteria bacterium]